MRLLNFVSATALAAAICVPASKAESVLAEWNFNYKYSVADGYATPTATLQSGNGGQNLHDIRILPDATVLGTESSLRPFRATRQGQVASQDDKGAYIEQNAINCDGAALHLTSPVPTPKEAASSFSWGTSQFPFPDGNSYSYSNPYNYFEIVATPTAYKDLSLTLKAAGHNSSSQYYAVAYSTDLGKTWIQTGDRYLTGASYNRWETTTIPLPEARPNSELRIRIFPSHDWQGAGASVSSDNQFDLDEVRLTGTLTAKLAEITGVSVTDAKVTSEGRTHECSLSESYGYPDIEIKVTAANATVKATATAEDGTPVECTDKGSGVFSAPLPAPNKAVNFTLTAIPADGAVAEYPTHTLRVFRTGKTVLGTLSINGVAADEAIMNALLADNKAVMTGTTYTEMPQVTATTTAGKEATVSSTFASDDHRAIYTISCDEAVYTLWIDDVYPYFPTEADKQITLNYTSAGKVDNGTWTDGLYTLTTTKLDGWNGSQFKFNADDMTLSVPAGVIVKQFILVNYAANYGNGEGLTSLTSEGATAHIPTKHDFAVGKRYNCTVTLDGHKPGAPISFTIKTNNKQPYASIGLVIEQTDPGTRPELRSADTKVDFNHAIVSLTFDREMKDMEATVAGKTVTAQGGAVTLRFGLWDLEYDTTYPLTVAAGAACDLFGNSNAEPITVNVVVPAKPVAEKVAYDYVVSNPEEFKAALSAINKSNSKADSPRKTIFMLDGDYDFGSAEQKFTSYNVSIIGQSRDGVVIRGTRNGISNPVLSLRDRSGFYLQDLTLRNDFNYGMADKNSGQAVAVYGGDKTIMKNVLMLGNQDTQVTGHRAYFDRCEIHGTVDFICGGGDNFYDHCDLVLEDRAGNVIAAPNTSADLKWGYVFSSCTIKAVPGAKEVTDGSFHLGRPWQNEPRIAYIDTRMEVLPADAGWTSMGNLNTHFYEFGSVDKDGDAIDLSVRKNSPTSLNTYVPVLTPEQAAAHTIVNVLSGAEGWLPTDYTPLTPAPAAKADDLTISWEENPDVRLVAIFKDGKFVDQVTGTSFTAPAEGTYTLRSANAMGGLSTESVTVTAGSSSILDIDADRTDIVGTALYNLQGIRVADTYRGTVIRVSTHADGTVSTEKILR